jgi:hypothetical protein
MLVTRKDVQDYWTRYCERHDVGGEILAEGLRQISLNCEYWTDHTMPELREVAINRLHKNSE